MIGDTYGKLTIVGKKVYNNGAVKVRCTCGKILTRRLHRLWGGSSCKDCKVSANECHVIIRDTVARGLTSKEIEMQEAYRKEHNAN